MRTCGSKSNVVPALVSRLGSIHKGSADFTGVRKFSFLWTFYWKIRWKTKIISITEKNPAHLFLKTLDPFFASVAQPPSVPSYALAINHPPDSTLRERERDNNSFSLFCRTTQLHSFTPSLSWTDSIHPVSFSGMVRHKRPDETRAGVKCKHRYPHNQQVRNTWYQRRPAGTEVHVTDATEREGLTSFYCMLLCSQSYVRSH